MNAMLDLYVEKLIAKMNLDDSQRVPVEREIRDHLEQAVEEAQRQGLTREQAENEAIVRFGQPSVIARQFGVTHSGLWLLFERLCVGIVVYVIFFYGEFLFADLESNLRHVAALFIAMAAIARPLWDRVEVNGTLRIYRLFRRTASVPFEAVREVRFEKGHLFGARRVAVIFDGGKTTFSSRTRNARVAGLALEVLAPEAVAPDVRELFRRLRLRIRTEGKLFRWGVTFIWIAALALFFWGAAEMWWLRGMPLAALAAGVAMAIALFIQFARHADRARRGLAALLIGAAVWIMMLSVLFVVFSDLRHVRWIATAFPFLAAGGLLILWWQAQRQTLLASILALACAWAASWFMIPTPDLPPRQVYATQPGTPMQGTWVQGAESEYPIYTALVRSQEQSSPDTAGYFLITTSRRNSQFQSLPPGDWSMVLPPETTNTVLLTRLIEQKNGPGGAELYRATIVDGNRSSIERILSLPEEHCWSWVATLPFPLVSPNREIVVTPICIPKDSGVSMSLSLTHLPSGRTFAISRFNVDDIWEWSSENKLQIIDAIRSGKAEDPRFSYEKWLLDPLTGEEEFQGKLEFDGGRRTIAGGRRFGRYAPLQRQGSMAIGDLETGNYVDLPEAVSHELDWNSSLARVAYVAPQAQSSGQRIILAGIEGVLGEHVLAPGEQVEMLRLSNDGNKVFFAVCDRDKLRWRGVELRVIDFARREVETIDYLNLFESFTLWFASALPGGPVQWSLDDRSILYPLIGIVRDGADVKIGTTYRVADFATWMRS